MVRLRVLTVESFLTSPPHSAGSTLGQLMHLCSMLHIACDRSYIMRVARAKGVSSLRRGHVMHVKQPGLSEGACVRVLHGASDQLVADWLHYSTLNP